MIASAPAARTMSSLSLLATAASTLAPIALASWIAARPTPPVAPSISTVSPGCDAAAILQREIGGVVDQRHRGGLAERQRRRQLDALAFRHHGELGEAAGSAISSARSPGLNFVTPSPTAATTPTGSLPGMNGSAGLN